MAGISSSTLNSGADVDPYVLEYAVNMRWLLWYAASLVDPTIEQRYPVFIRSAATMNPIMTRLTFDGGCTLADLPFGVLRLSREAVLYLLVSDHLLGGCPPTMHAFLERAVTAAASHKPRVRAPSPSSSPQSSPLPARKGAAHPDLNVSFPSADTDDEDGDGVAGDRRATGRLASSSSSYRRLDAQPLAAIDPASDDVAALADVYVMGSAVQAMLLLLRWLFSEGVLAEEELTTTLELDGPGADDVHSGTSATAQQQQFSRHRQLALHLAKLVPFFLGAHLLLTRSLLLQYCATLLTCEGVMAHVTQLQAALPPPRQRSPSAPPPKSVEGALLDWFQTVMDSIRFSEDGAAVLARMRGCAPLQAYVQDGPFCAHAMEPADRDLFRLVQSGECVCVALLFYCPDTVALDGLATALREGAAYFAAGTGDAADVAEAWDGLQRHQSLCYWTAAAAAARQLGVSLLLSPGEVVAHGRTALPLHLFRFVQQLFAVLATNAEEDVRVSADTAWWEVMQSADGLSARMRSAADRADAAGTVPTLPSSSSFSGAQQLLRRSVSGAFPPSALVRQSYPVPEGEAEQVRMDSARRGRQARGKGPEGATDGVAADRAAVERSVATPEVLGSLGTGTDVTSATQKAVLRSDADSEDAGSLTEFSVRLAGTQRGEHRGDRPARETTVETATSVLRPMVRGRSSTRTSAALSGSATAATASIDSPAVQTTAPRRETPAAARTAAPRRGVELGTHAVDTYVTAEEDAQQTATGSRVRRDDDRDAQVKQAEALPTSPRAPAAAETLLHAREVEAALPGLAARAPAAHTQQQKSDARDVAVTVQEAARTPLGDSDDSSVANAAPGRFADEDLITVNVAPPSSHSAASSSLTQSVDFVVRCVTTGLAAAARAASTVPELPRNGDRGDEVHTPCAASTVETREDRITAGKVVDAPAVFVTASPQVFESGTLAPGSGSVPVVRRFVSLESQEGDTDDDAGDDTAAPLHKSDDASSSPSSWSSATPTSAAALAKASTARPNGMASADDSAHALQLSRRAVARGDPEAPSSSAQGPIPRDEGDAEGAFSPSLSVTDIAVEDDEASLMAASAEEGRTPIVPRDAAPRSASPPRGSKQAVQAEEMPGAEVREAPREPHVDTASHLSEVRVTPAHPYVVTEALSTASPTAGAPACTPQLSVVSPSPVQPDSYSRSAGRHHRVPAAVLEVSPARGLSDSGALTPPTPALTLSVSEVYGSDYASLLEGVATSEVDLLRRRHRGGEDEDSWYSSASRAYPSSLRSAAASTASAPPAMQETTRVLDLLERLGKVDLAELAHKEKHDLYEALAQQQAVVDQLKTALRDGRHRQPTRRRFSYSPSFRPTLLQRRRRVKVETPLEGDSRDAAAMSPLRDRVEASVVPRRTSGAASPATSAAVCGERRRSLSGMTVESATSAARTLQSDLGAQLAETDVSSEQPAVSMSASALSGAPSP